MAVEELRFDDVANRDAADAMRIQMAQCRRQIGISVPTIPRSQKNFHCTCLVRIQKGFWRSALLGGRLSPCPILNYGYELCCNNVSDVFVWRCTSGVRWPHLRWVAMGALGKCSSMKGSEDLRRHGIVSWMQALSTEPDFVQRREVKKRRSGVL